MLDLHFIEGHVFYVIGIKRNNKGFTILIEEC